MTVSHIHHLHQLVSDMLSMLQRELLPPISRIHQSISRTSENYTHIEIKRHALVNCRSFIPGYLPHVADFAKFKVSTRWAVDHVTIFFNLSYFFCRNGNWEILLSKPGLQHHQNYCLVDNQLKKKRKSLTFFFTLPET